MARCWRCGNKTKANTVFCQKCQTSYELLGVGTRTGSLHIKGVYANISEKSGIDLNDIKGLVSSDIEEEMQKPINYQNIEDDWLSKQKGLPLNNFTRILSEETRNRVEELWQVAEELRRLHRYGEAMERFAQAERLNPLDYRLYLGWGFAHLFNNELDRAIELFEKAVKTEIPYFYKSYTNLLIARTYFAQNKYKKALQHAKLALGFAPEYAETSYSAAYYSAVLGKNEEALDLLKDAVEKNESYIEIARDRTVLRRLEAKLERMLAEMKSGLNAKAKEKLNNAKKIVKNLEDLKIEDISFTERLKKASKIMEVEMFSAYRLVERITDAVVSEMEEKVRKKAEQSIVDMENMLEDSEWYNGDKYDPVNFNLAVEKLNQARKSYKNGSVEDYRKSFLLARDGFNYALAAKSEGRKHEKRKRRHHKHSHRVKYGFQRALRGFGIGAFAGILPGCMAGTFLTIGLDFWTRFLGTIICCAGVGAVIGFYDGYRSYRTRTW